MTLTITGAKQENVAMENESPKIKVVLYFAETEKGLVLGKTTATQIASFLGDPGETPKAWYGKQIEAFNDPSIMFKGKMTGGIRVRQPRGQAIIQQQQQPVQQQQPNKPAGDDNW